MSTMLSARWAFVWAVSMKMMSNATASLKSKSAVGFATRWGCGRVHFAHVLHWSWLTALTISESAPARRRWRSSSRLLGCPRFWWSRRSAPAILLLTEPLNLMPSAPRSSSAGISLSSTISASWGSSVTRTWWACIFLTTSTTASAKSME